MRKRMLTVVTLSALLMAAVSLSACQGSKKSRYNGCPTFSKNHPTEKPVAQKHG